LPHIRQNEAYFGTTTHPFEYKSGKIYNYMKKTSKKIYFFTLKKRIFEIFTI